MCVCARARGRCMGGRCIIIATCWKIYVTHCYRSISVDILREETRRASTIGIGSLDIHSGIWDLEVVVSGCRAEVTGGPGDVCSDFLGKLWHESGLSSGIISILLRMFKLTMLRIFKLIMLMFTPPFACVSVYTII